MKRSWAICVAAICLSCSAVPADNFKLSHPESDARGTYDQPVQVEAAANQFHARFQDRTQEIVGHALKLIEANEREGAPLDQRWYAFRRFGDHFEEILTAREVRFYGGRDADILRAITTKYPSIGPLVPDQDPGEIRLFRAQRDADSWDLVIIGQNGSEVALKTVIRLIYGFKLMEQRYKRGVGGELDSFLRKIKIYLSSTPAREEFISFFQQYRISDVAVVIIGFQRDARAALTAAGVPEPERYSSDSLRVNWYRDVNGRKVLLVSINGNRIFSSRAGELIEAMLATFRSPPEFLVFFGSAGAINTPKLVGQIVAPTVVVADYHSNPDSATGKLAYIIRNRAARIVPVKNAHVSVESVVLETLNWARMNSQRRITTVDQELFHVIKAVNGSRSASEIQLFVGMLVTDNVSAIQDPDEMTLQDAENVIARTVDIRRRFLAEVLAQAGIIHTTPHDHAEKRRINQ